MTEPTTVNIGLVVPNTGDLVGAWGTASLNPNFSVIDGLFGGVVSLSLSAATTITLNAAGFTPTPGAGPAQSFNKMISLSGALLGTAIIKVVIPKDYIVDNQTTGNFPVVLAPSSGGGTQIGVPQGKKTSFVFDGTNVDFLNPPDPGTAIDLHGVTSVPAWMTSCTKQYALIKDGTSYSAAAFPALFNVIGTAFGGPGVSFNVPDEGQRMRLAWSGSATRVTSGGSGIAGNTMGATGGDQLMQSHNHIGTATVTDPGHLHGVGIPNGANDASGTGPSPQTGGFYQTQTATTNISVSVVVGTTGSGGSQNMPPSIVSFLALIKT